MSNTIVSIPFHGTKIIALDENGAQWISPRHVCDAIGLAFSKQLQKLKSKSWACVSLKDTRDSSGRAQQMTMIDRRTFTMWLATIETSRIGNPETRRLVEQFQSEAADALDAYFNEGGAINPRATEHQIRSLELRAQSQLEMIQAAKGLIHPDHLEAKARVVLARGLGEHAELDENRRPLYTQDYLKERGIKGKALASTAGMFGKRVKAAYVEKYGVEPEKYPLNVKNGQTRSVLAYTEQDRHLMDDVWRQYYGETEPSTPELDLA